MNGNLEQIGKRIEGKRKEKKYTYQDMGDFLGVSQKIYRRMEEGKQSFTVDHLQTLCIMFHVSPDWVLTGQPGLLEWTEIIEKIREAPEEYRNLASKIQWNTKEALRKSQERK